MGYFNFNGFTPDEIKIIQRNLDLEATGKAEDAQSVANIAMDGGDKLGVALRTLQNDRNINLFAANASQLRAEQASVLPGLDEVPSQSVIIPVGSDSVADLVPESFNSAKGGMGSKGGLDPKGGMPYPDPVPEAPAPREPKTLLDAKTHGATLGGDLAFGADVDLVHEFQNGDVLRSSANVGDVGPNLIEITSPQGPQGVPTTQRSYASTGEAHDIRASYEKLLDGNASITASGQFSERNPFNTEHHTDEKEQFTGGITYTKKNDKGDTFGVGAAFHSEAGVGGYVYGKTQRDTENSRVTAEAEAAIYQDGYSASGKLTGQTLINENLDNKNSRTYLAGSVTGYAQDLGDAKQFGGEAIAKVINVKSDPDNKRYIDWVGTAGVAYHSQEATGSSIGKAGRVQEGTLFKAEASFEKKLGDWYVGPVVRYIDAQGRGYEFTDSQAIQAGIRARTDLDKDKKHSLAVEGTWHHDLTSKQDDLLAAGVYRYEFGDEPASGSKKPLSTRLSNDQIAANAQAASLAKYNRENGLPVDPVMARGEAAHYATARENAEMERLSKGGKPRQSGGYAEQQEPYTVTHTPTVTTVGSTSRDATLTSKDVEFLKTLPGKQTAAAPEAEKPSKVSFTSAELDFLKTAHDPALKGASDQIRKDAGLIDLSQEATIKGLKSDQFKDKSGAPVVDSNGVAASQVTAVQKILKVQGANVEVTGVADDQTLAAYNSVKDKAGLGEAVHSRTSFIDSIGKPDDKGNRSASVETKATTPVASADTANLGSNKQEWKAVQKATTAITGVDLGGFDGSPGTKTKAGLTELEAKAAEKGVTVSQLLSDYATETGTTKTVVKTGLGVDKDGKVAATSTGPETKVSLSAAESAYLQSSVSNVDFSTKETFQASVKKPTTVQVDGKDVTLSRDDQERAIQKGLQLTGIDIGKADSDFGRRSATGVVIASQIAEDTQTTVAQIFSNQAKAYDEVTKQNNLDGVNVVATYKVEPNGDIKVYTNDKPSQIPTPQVDDKTKVAEQTAQKQTTTEVVTPPPVAVEEVPSQTQTPRTDTIPQVTPPPVVSEKEEDKKLVQEEINKPLPPTVTGKNPTPPPKTPTPTPTPTPPTPTPVTPTPTPVTPVRPPVEGVQHINRPNGISLPTELPAELAATLKQNLSPAGEDRATAKLNEEDVAKLAKQSLGTDAKDAQNPARINNTDLAALQKDENSRSA